MQFSLLLTLAALAAAAPAPNLGYFDVSFTRSFAANGFRSEDLNSTYHNNKLSKGKPVNVICSYRFTPPNTESKTCSDPTFSYVYDSGSSNITLQQTVKLGGKNTTVSGTGPIALQSNSVGNGQYGNATVKATKARRA